MGTCACGRRCEGSICPDCKRDADWEDTFCNTDFGEEDEETPDVLTDGGIDQDTDGTEHPFDVATKNDQRVNEMLADTDGAICTMEFNGAIGYHINVAKGETDPEHLWKIALLQALDESVFEMMYVDAETPRNARAQLERDLEDAFNPHTAEYITDVFEDKLIDLIEVQEGQSANPDTDEDLVTDGGQPVDGTDRFKCPECGRMVTRGPSGVEYGHERGRGDTGQTERCSRRPESVDPSGGVDHDGWCLPGGETASKRPVTDGGQDKISAMGAIDSDFGANERSAREQLEDTVEGIQTEPMAGGVAIDLVTRQPLFVRRIVAESITTYYEAEEFDLYSYKTHPYLPVRLDDPVYECVYISGNPEGAHNAGNTYDFPRGRLMHVPVEEAWADGGDSDA